MNEINADALLNQIRTLGKSLQTPPVVNPVGDPSGNSVTTPRPVEFGSLLKDSLDAVNSLQRQSGELKTGFQNGTTDSSLAEVMIASQKADISFRAVTEVRNKLIQAYQDIMNMPV